ncbi:MFS transporter [Sphingobium sp.]|uniref:MFS transporter n=1 Tax=Sphingobium sp. TaxID=1912891 RepID=UPI002C930A6F|nr:MFS transporter [Sphingobium sp.]HUD92923.1 MFS transporter [Sphingobium sp.]
MVTVSSRAEQAPEQRSRYRWIVLALLFTTYTVAYADRANVGIVIPFMKRDYGLTNTEAGLILALFALSYALFQVPAAFVVKRLGIRKSFSLFMGATSIVSGAMAFMTSAASFSLCRFILGVTEAPVAVGAVTTVNNWFPPKEKGRAIGILISSSKFAPVVVPPLGAYIIYAFGWHHVFLVFAIPGLLLAGLWWLMVPNVPAESRHCNSAEVDHIAGRGRSADTGSGGTVSQAFGDMGLLDRIIRLRRVAPIRTASGVFRSWNVWGAALGYFCLAGIIGVILTWLPTYLIEVRKMAILKVGFVAAAPFAGAVIGNIAGGWLSDSIFGGRRKPIMFVSAISTIATMFALVNAPANAIILAAALFGTGFLLSVGYAPYTIYASRMTTRETFPLAMSLTNTGGQMGTAAFPFLTGMILDRANWDAVFLMLSGSAFVAFLILLTIVEPVEADAGQAAA